MSSFGIDSISIGEMFDDGLVEQIFVADFLVGKSSFSAVDVDTLQTDHSHRKNLVGHRVVSVSWAMVRCISAPTLHLIHGKGNNTGHKTLL